MNYCKACGVELDNSMDSCPLCGQSVYGESAPPIKTMPEPEPSLLKDKLIYDYKCLTEKQKKKLFWEISGIILISGILVTLVINFIVSENFDWAKYNLVVSLALFANISFFTFWRSRPVLIILGSLTTISLLLLLLDLFSSNLGWGTKLGIPILVSFYILLLAVIFITKLSHRRGFNILAIIFIAAGLFMICIEMFISLYFLGVLRLSWSIIAGASIIPISAILLFVHYRLKTAMDLKRFFHI